jgi:anti-sigma factor RsiW
VDRWTDRLSEYLDDELDARDRAAIEQHLRECQACRTELAGLRDVIARASTLAPRPPASDLWPGIENRVRTIRPTRRTWTFSLPQLAAAALVLMAVSGGLVWVLRAPTTGAPMTEMTRPNADRVAATGRHRPTTALPVSFPDQSYERAVTDLQRALAEDRARLDPSTVAVIEKNLQTIDAAIAQAQRALEADPSNTYLNGHLADARRRKLALLRSVSRITDPEG